MSKNTKIANVVTIGGVILALSIAQLPTIFNVITLTATILGCVYLTKKEKETSL